MRRCRVRQMMSDPSHWPVLPHDVREWLEIQRDRSAIPAADEMLLETFPRARVVLHDYSEPMIAEAAKALTEFGDQVSFVRGDLMTPDWVENLDGQFDAVVSSIAIHNVRYPDRIHGTYREMFPYVAPGGCFLNLDRIELPPFESVPDQSAAAGLPSKRWRLR